MVIGRGSNLLVRDGGVPGVVANLSKGEFARYTVNGNEVTAGAGVKLKQLTAIARNAGIGGFEWMEGIPGNLGGSLRMNAVRADGRPDVRPGPQRSLLLPRRQHLYPLRHGVDRPLPRCADPPPKLCPLRHVARNSLRDRGNRNPHCRFGTQTARIAANCRKRRLHFQKSRSNSRRQIDRGARIQKLHSRKGERFRSA